MLALGVDTSNYATSLAVVDTGRKEVVCALKRFLPVQEGALGLRQSDAVFHHTVALPEMLEELGQKAPMGEIESVGVSQRPRPVAGSYMPCFLAGVAFATAFAAGRGVPVYKTSHQQGHLAAALYGAGVLYTDDDRLFFHVSGGTTELLLTHGCEIVEKLGGSLDLHAGQLVDRLGVRLGFPFPAGAKVSELAQNGAFASNTSINKLKISVNGMNCHLSGLQNQYEALLDDGQPPADVARACLSALARTVEAMVAAARQRCPGAPALCAGGVMSSSVIREYLAAAIPGTLFAPPELSCDNAVGVALMAGRAADSQ